MLVLDTPLALWPDLHFEGLVLRHNEKLLGWFFVDSCLVCGRKLDQPEGSGRRRRYCSPSCRQQAYLVRLSVSGAAREMLEDTSEQAVTARREARKLATLVNGLRSDLRRLEASRERVKAKSDAEVGSLRADLEHVTAAKQQLEESNEAFQRGFDSLVSQVQQAQRRASTAEQDVSRLRTRVNALESENARLRQQASSSGVQEPLVGARQSLSRQQRRALERAARKKTR